MILLFWHKP